MSPDTLDAPGTATSGAMTGAVPAPAEQAHDPRARLRKHKALVYSLRVLVLVGVLAFWEFSVRLWLDPFFYSQPSLIWKKLVTWFTDGTAQGPIWEQISVTLQEAVYGFLTGMSPEECVNLGAAHGALLQTTRGDSSQITKEELMHVFKGGSARIKR